VVLHGVRWYGPPQGCLGGGGNDVTQDCHTQRVEGPRRGMHVPDGTTPRVVGLGDRVDLLARTGLGNRRGHGRELEMPQNTCDHRLLRDDGNDP
jgi:hypothetical protein